MTFSESALSTRKRSILASLENQTLTRSQWRERASFFHAEDTAYLRFLIPPGLRILDLGCGAGHTLAALAPSRGVGIDFAPRIVAEGRSLFPDLELHVGDVEADDVFSMIHGTFDVILLVDTMGSLDDCQALFERLHRFCTRETRLIVAYYSHLWNPLIKLAERIGWKIREGSKNVLSPSDIRAIAALADFDPVKSETRLLSPLRLFGIGRFLNRFLAPLPLIRALALRNYIVCRSRRHVDDGLRSATVVIPARNERGNIEPAVRRMPRFCDDIEIVFVEGHSRDGTLDEMRRVQGLFPDWDIKVMTQTGIGKADAVFTAFAAARGDVLMILDADLTMPPEQLPKFWAAIRSGQGEFINGSRLVYPLAGESMRFLNLIANRLFSLIFTWLLNQRFTDTLCGTKVLRRSDYHRLDAGRSYFGDFDPFGDFDLIFGAAKLNLKTVEVPIRYEARSYGETQISRFSHGRLLLRMIVFAFFKIKAL